MSWIVRVLTEDSNLDSITTAAIMADCTGCAEVTDPAAPGSVTLMVGFDRRPEADDFAAGIDGATVEAADPSSWTRNEIAEVAHSSGILELEVGTAFGHGGHATTGLALAAIERLGGGEGRTLLDVGCGTGVLSIAAARQGFIVSGCDIDPDAVAISTRNADRNAVGEQTSFVCASPSQLATPAWLMRSTGFDVVVANTLIGVHEAEAHAISSLTASTAPIVVTGLQGQHQLERAVSAYESRIASKVTSDGDWILAVLSAP